MHKPIIPICLLLSLCSLCAIQAHAQSIPVSIQLQDGRKDTLFINSPALMKKVQDALMQPLTPDEQQKYDKDITELTNTILHRSPLEITLRPFALRVDFVHELVALTKEDILRKRRPVKSEAFTMDLSITYNMSKANMEGARVGIHLWDIMRVRDFYVSDYDIETDTNWFWAEDWK